MVREPIDIIIRGKDEASPAIDKVTVSLGRLQRAVKLPTEGIKKFSTSVSKATRSSRGRFMELYFSVLGLQFSLMFLNRLITSFTSSIFSATLEATNYSGALAEIDAQNKSAWQGMLVTIGTNEKFAEGLKSVRELINSLVKWFGDFIDKHETLASILGVLAGLLPVVVGFVAALAGLFMVLGSSKLVIGAIANMVSFGGSLGAASAAGLPLIAVVLALVAAIGLLYFAYKNNWFGFRDMIDKMRAFWFAFTQRLKEGWKNVLSDMFIITLTKMINHALGLFKKFYSMFDRILGTHYASSIDEIMSQFERAKNLGTATFQTYYHAKLAEIQAERARTETGEKGETLIVNGLTFNVSSREEVFDILDRMMSSGRELAGDVG